MLRAPSISTVVFPEFAIIATERPKACL